MSEYGVLLISGNRTHQENHAATFHANPKCRLIAVADEPDISEYRAELNKELAKAYDIPYIPNLDEALSRDDVDIVSMCADVERRGRVAVRCAEAGKHLYLDKPLAGSVEDANNGFLLDLGLPLRDCLETLDRKAVCGPLEQRLYAER